MSLSPLGGIRSGVILRQRLQRRVFAEAVDDVVSSSLCDASDVEIEFLHCGVVFQSSPQL